MKRKIALFLLAMVIAASAALPASARDTPSYYFTLYERNETDLTGCFDEANGYKTKVTSYIDAAIRVDSNTGLYSVKTTLNYAKSTRGTDYAWIQRGGRATPAYRSGFGYARETYILWVRRDAGENAYATTITGSWSPDEY